MMLLNFVILYLCVLQSNASVLKRSVQQLSEPSVLINGSNTINATKPDLQKSSCDLVITKDGHVIAAGDVAFAVAGVENQVYCDATCTGSGMPPALKWFKHIKNGEKRKIYNITKYSSKRVYAVRTTFNRISILTISNMLGRDTGKYTCRGWLTNKGWVEKSIYLSYSCGSSSFMCDGTRCMNSDLLCNGFSDCRDGEDEGNCATSTTPTTTMITAEAIPTIISTDYNDYYNNDNCTEEEFECGGDCISASAVCDGLPDCEDSEDEQNCSLPSSPCDNGFECKPGLCIVLDWVCDGTNDCPDGSDEANCPELTSKTTNNPTTSTDVQTTDMTSQETPSTTDFTTALPYLPCDNGFECEPGLCIVLNWVCDGTRDCPDGSDEASCLELTSMTTNVPTTSTDVQTTDMTSQETPSTTEATTGCSVDEFSCAPEECVSISAICDDVPDCSNGMDEKNCIPAISCNEGMVTCVDGGLCISPSQKCDGEPQCLDGSDEQDCNTITEEFMDEEVFVATLDDTKVEFSETLDVMKISQSD